MSGTWMVVNERGQQVGKVSSVPILSLEKGERVSYRSDVFFDYDSRGLSKEKRNILIQKSENKGCVATIETETWVVPGKYEHIFNVIGNNPIVVGKMVEDLLYSFTQVDFDWTKIAKKSFMPRLESFWKRFKYLSRWLFTGKTQEIRRPKIKRIGLRPKYQEKFQLKTGTYLKKLPKKGINSGN